MREGAGEETGVSRGEDSGRKEKRERKVKKFHRRLCIGSQLIFHYQHRHTNVSMEDIVSQIQVHFSVCKDSKSD